MAENDLALIAYRIATLPPLPIVAASPDRTWMNGLPDGYARRCLPLRMANQSGWFILNDAPIRAVWLGGKLPASLQIESSPGSDAVDDDRATCAVSHFGHGILTWRLPYLFRTPPGYNLLVRGPANWPKEGAFPYEGVVETDWSPATFTMNWQLSRVGQVVTFEAGDPICMIVPQRRSELEKFRPEFRELGAEPVLSASYEHWRDGRKSFLTSLRQPDSDARRRPWQRHYVLGHFADGTHALDGEHQTKRHLRAFRPLPTGCETSSSSEQYWKGDHEWTRDNSTT